MKNVENTIRITNSTHYLNNLVDLAAPGYVITVSTNYQDLKYRGVLGTSTAATSCKWYGWFNV